MTAFIIIKHYLKRAFMNQVEIALMTLLPVGIIVLTMFLNMEFMTGEEGAQFLWNGYDLINTGNVHNIMVMFMFMSGAYAGEWYFKDMRGVNRWRLNATPVASFKFLLGAISGGFLFSSLTGGFVLAVGYFFMDMYLGNLAVVIAVLFLIVLMSQFIGICVAVFAKTTGAINGVMMALSFAMASMAGAFFIPIPMPQFVVRYILPYGVSLFALRGGGQPITDVVGSGFSDSLLHLGILTGMTVVSGIAALILVRRRPA